MMMNSNLEELIKALETIRAEQYPELPKELLEALLLVEFDNQDNRADAQSKCLKILDDFFNKNVD